MSPRCLIEHGLQMSVSLLHASISLGNSLDNEKFKVFMKEVLAEREEALLEKNKMVVNIVPAIASIFENSKNVTGRRLCSDSESSEEEKGL